MIVVFMHQCAMSTSLTLPAQPAEKFVFGRRVGRSQRQEETVW